MKYIASVILALFAGLFCTPYVYAVNDSVDWINADFSKQEFSFTDSMESNFGVCKKVNRVDIVSDMEYMNGATLPYKGCIIEGKDVDMYVAPFTNINGDNPRNFAIRIKPSGKFYFLKPGAAVSAQYVQLISGTNMYIEWRSITQQRKMIRTMDIRDTIKADRFDSDGNPIRYILDDTSSNVDSYTFNNIDNSISAGPVTKSGNVLFWSGGGWLYKTDLETGNLAVKYMPGQDVNWQNVPFSSNNIYPIDPDGRYVYLGGNLDMLVDTDKCGQYFIDADQTLSEQTNCKMRSLKGLVNVDSQPGTSVFGARFDGNKLQIGTYRVAPQGSERFLVEFLPNGLSGDSPQLDYLALGDSYSSGEGDNGIFFGEKHYRKGTDEQGPPQEKCHISTRSYPYLLANTQKLESTKWSTVACSGALVKKDYYALDNNGRYQGQQARLKDLDSDQLYQYRNQANESFIPGRLQQIEFVKKYQPKVITITGGGNDVGFGEVLRICVGVFDPDSTCTYAGDSRGKSMLGKEIERQYESVRSLVRSLKNASPSTTIYYVGYPQFLKETNEECGLGVSLSTTERGVFRDANIYLNKVIKAAAETEGAVYVDIENVLDGHLLCEDNPYVTGYNADCDDRAIIKFFRGKDECQESFHPKPSGHALMASRILTLHSNIMHDKPCEAPRICVKVTELSDVDVPKIFTDAYAQDAKANRVPIKGGLELAAQKDNIGANIVVSTGELQPNSIANSYLTSDPIFLGTLQVGSDGVVTINEVVPNNTPAGYHTLHVDGVSKSGEPVEVWWIIRIFGKDGDVDEDGISDDVDKCIFMPTLNADEDKDHIDDGCDSDVNGSDIASRSKVRSLSPPFVLNDNEYGSNLTKTREIADSDKLTAGNNQEVYIRTTQSVSLDVSMRISKESGKRDNTVQYWLALATLMIVTVAIYTIIRLRTTNDKSGKQN